MSFQPFEIQYSPHTDLSIHPATGVVTITVAHHPNNRGGYNCRVYEFAPPYVGKPILKREWEQGKNGIVGPFGHGASIVLPTGARLTVVPVGLDSVNNVTPAFQIEPGYSAPYQLGGDVADLLARIAQIEARLAQAGLPSRSTVVAAPDDPIWRGDAMRIVQVLEYYGWIERG